MLLFSKLQKFLKFFQPWPIIIVPVLSKLKFTCPRIISSGSFVQKGSKNLKFSMREKVFLVASAKKASYVSMELIERFLIISSFFCFLAFWEKKSWTHVVQTAFWTYIQTFTVKVNLDNWIYWTSFETFTLYFVLGFRKFWNLSEIYRQKIGMLLSTQPFLCPEDLTESSLLSVFWRTLILPFSLDQKLWTGVYHTACYVSRKTLEHFSW